MLIDSHCHLDHLQLSGADSLTAVLGRARGCGVTGMLSVATSPDAWPALRETVKGQANVWCAAGLHPEGVTADTSRIDLLQNLKRLAAETGMVALGETGLDYADDPSSVVRKQQLSCFETHMQVAADVGLPLIVHTRAACADTISVIKEGPACRGVIHCFTEDYDAACAFIDLGFYISFSGILTFKSAQSLREVAARLPLDRVLIETDSPWLAPVPHRGKANEPAWVAEVARCLAECLEVSLDAVAQATNENFFALFDRAQRQ